MTDALAAARRIQAAIDYTPERARVTLRREDARDLLAELERRAEREDELAHALACRGDDVRRLERDNEALAANLARADQDCAARTGQVATGVPWWLVLSCAPILFVGCLALAWTVNGN